MDPASISERLGPRHEYDTRTARVCRERVQALASSRQAQKQAEAFWVEEPIPAGDPRRADQIRRCFGVCLEGGHTRPWHPIPTGAGQVPSQQDRLGGHYDQGQSGGLLRDRARSNAEVRNVWSLSG